MKPWLLRMRTNDSVVTFEIIEPYSDSVIGSHTISRDYIEKHYALLDMPLDIVNKGSARLSMLRSFME